MKIFQEWLEQIDPHIAETLASSLILDNHNTLDKKAFQSMLQNAISQSNEQTYPSEKILTYLLALEYYRRYPEEITKTHTDFNPLQIIFDATDFAISVEKYEYIPNVVEVWGYVRQRYADTVHQIIDSGSVVKRDQYIANIAILAALSSYPETAYGKLCQKYNVLKTNEDNHQAMQMCGILRIFFDEPIRTFLLKHSVECLITAKSTKKGSTCLTLFKYGIDPDEFCVLIKHMHQHGMDKFLSSLVYTADTIQNAYDTVILLHTYIQDFIETLTRDAQKKFMDEHAMYIHWLILQHNSNNQYIDIHKNRIAELFNNLNEWSETAINLCEDIVKSKNTLQERIAFLYTNKTKWQNNACTINTRDIFEYPDRQWTPYTANEKNDNHVRFVLEECNLSSVGILRHLANAHNRIWDILRQDIPRYLLPLFELIEDTDDQNEQREVRDFLANDNAATLYTTDPLWLRLIAPDIRENIDISNVKTVQDKIQLIMQHTYPPELFNKIQDTLRIEKSLDMKTDIQSIYKASISHVSPLDPSTLLSV